MNIIHDFGCFHFCFGHGGPLGGNIRLEPGGQQLGGSLQAKSDRNIGFMSLYDRYNT